LPREVVGDQQRAILELRHVHRTSKAMPVSLSRKPSAKISVLSAVPSGFSEVNMIRYPIGTVRFQEPCSATKTPPWYFAGNFVPE